MGSSLSHAVHIIHLLHVSNSEQIFSNSTVWKYSFNQVKLYFFIKISTKCLSTPLKKGLFHNNINIRIELQLLTHFIFTAEQGGTIFLFNALHFI